MSTHKKKETKRVLSVKISRAPVSPTFTGRDENLHDVDKPDLKISDAWRVVEVGKLFLSVLNQAEIKSITTYAGRNENSLELDQGRISQNLSFSAHSEVISTLE